MLSRDFADWLRAKMDGRGLSQTQVAAYLDLNSSAVSRWLSGSSRPDPENIGKLAQLFQTAAAPLYALAGYPNPGWEPPERQPLSLRDATMEYQSFLPVEVPVIVAESLAAAGEGQVAVLEYLYLPPSRGRGHNLLGLRVRGNSMEPLISDGDTVIIDRDATPHDGDTVVASVGDEVVVKHLVQKRDQYVLAGTNGKIIPGADAHIAGVVVQIVRDVPRG